MATDIFIINIGITRFEVLDFFVLLIIDIFFDKLLFFFLWPLNVLEWVLLDMLCKAKKVENRGSQSGIQIRIVSIKESDGTHAKEIYDGPENKLAKDVERDVLGTDIAIDERVDAIAINDPFKVGDDVEQPEFSEAG